MSLTDQCSNNTLGKTVNTVINNLYVYLCMRNSNIKKLTYFLRDRFRYL